MSRHLGPGVELHVYASSELPDDIRCQILCFLRIHFPEGFVGRNRLRNWISPEEDHPRHAVLVEDGVLISHTEVKWKRLAHAGETYKVYGLSGVLTYPAFRGGGYGRRIVEEGTRLITQSDADLGMFHCDPRLREFYAKCGWMPLEDATTLQGDASHPTASRELMMAMFLSDKAREHEDDFHHTPVYFGEDTW